MESYIQRKQIMEEMISPSKYESIDRLTGKGNLYLRFSKQHAKWKYKKSNSDIESRVVSLVLIDDAEHCIADLRSYGNLNARNLYPKIIEVLENGGRIEESYSTGQVAPCVFDSDENEIAFSAGYKSTDF